MEPILDENNKPVELKDLVSEAARELMRERRHEASNLIKNYLVKVEQVTEKLKFARQEVAKLEGTLNDTLEKIKRLKEGDWSLLKENKSRTIPESSQKQEQ